MATKLEQAVDIVKSRSEQKWNKESIINDIEKRAKCTPGSAIAYYYKAKKELLAETKQVKAKDKEKLKSKPVTKNKAAEDYQHLSVGIIEGSKVKTGEFTDGIYKVSVKQNSQLNVHVEVVNSNTVQKAFLSVSPYQKNITAAVADLKERLSHR